MCHHTSYPSRVTYVLLLSPSQPCHPSHILGKIFSSKETETEKGQELEEDEDLEEEEEEEEEEEMSHFSLRLEGGRPDSEDEEEVLIAPV